MLTPTHMFFSLALAYIFRLPKAMAFLAGLLIDLDIIFNILGLGFPFIHRGIVHTPLFILAVTGIWYYSRKKSKNAIAFGVGGLSHLFLDLITDQGIMLLYPFAGYFVFYLASYANLFANAGIVLLSLAVILIYQYRPKWIKPKNWRCTLFVFLLFMLLTVLIAYLSIFFHYNIWEPFVAFY